MASIVSSSIHLGRGINSGGTVVLPKYLTSDKKVNKPNNFNNFHTGPDFLWDNTGLHGIKVILIDCNKLSILFKDIKPNIWAPYKLRGSFLPVISVERMNLTRHTWHMYSWMNMHYNPIWILRFYFVQYIYIFVKKAIEEALLYMLSTCLNKKR